MEIIKPNPKEITGKEATEMLDVSPSTFQMWCKKYEREEGLDER